jgi:acetolactate decarboxylase
MQRFMKKIISAIFLFCAHAGFCQAPAKEAIHYISLNNAIQQGQYDGVSPLNWVRDLADFGVGSEENLKSEVVAIDGSFYKIGANGEAELMKGDDLLSYAALKNFTPDIIVRYEEPINFEELQRYLDKVVDLNEFSAIRIDALFESATFRCYAEQVKPYKPMDEIPEVNFTKENIKGTLVGFYTPSSASVMNSPSYHFHFIDDERKTGGHFKAGVLRGLVIHIDHAQAITIHLPPSESLDHVDLNKITKN